MITYRNYTNDDFQNLKNILTDADMFVEPWETEENISSMIEKDPNSIVLAVESENNEIIGSVFLIPYGAKVILIFRLNVKKEYRKQGIATEILEYITQQAQKRGIKEIGLFADQDKEYLQDYYLKRGFQKSSVPSYYMWKEI